MLATALKQRGFTLVEMLVAMAITLVMMAAVVTLFANVSNSVRNRRATIEMSGQLRHMRNVLQADLQGATCPGITWQRPESNHGYIEIVEGQYREGNATNLVNSDGTPATVATAIDPEIDHITSILPSSNFPYTDAPGKEDWATDGAGLGDGDDVLMLTSRNEEEPFVGRVPQARGVRIESPSGDSNPDTVEPFYLWDPETIESPLAEVVWFAVENPGHTDDPNDAADGDGDPSADGFFGEPGMRTIYRRTLLIAPWVNPYRYVDGNGVLRETFTYEGEVFKSEPGLVRLLPDEINREDLQQALAALVAFQERYDLSVRLEWDPNLDSDDGNDGGRYKIVANTLGDLTKRENRYEHHGYRPDASVRDYPYAALSNGSGYQGSNAAPVICWPDPESPPPPALYLAGPPYTEGSGLFEPTSKSVVAYALQNPFPPPSPVVRQTYKWRPFAFVNRESDTLATARVMLNDDEEVVRIVHGLVPLSGERRGEDVMMTDVLAFDLRVYDPGAPLFGVRDIPGDPSSAVGLILEPSDPGWRGQPGATPIPGAYPHNDNMQLNGNGAIGTAATTFPFAGQGAYVDLGYGFDARWGTALAALKPPRYAPAFASSSQPWFFEARALSDVFGRALAPGYTVYDTWSFHYENNGVNEDSDEIERQNGYDVPQIDNGDSVGRPQIDEGTDGMDSADSFLTLNPAPARAFPPGDFTVADAWVSGPDDVGERETAPPYDRPLRGIQALVRTYERDSRAIRQVRVNQHFLGE